MIEQQLDHIRPAMTDRFGERRPAELIGLVRIGPLLKKPSDIAGAFGPGGVGKRSAGCGGLPCFEFFQAFGSREVSGLRRDLVPMARLRRISIRAPAIFVHLAETVGRIRATRLGGAPIKLEGLGVVLRDTHAVAIEIGKLIGGFGIALVGRAAEDVDGGLVIPMQDSLPRGVDIRLRGEARRRGQQAGCEAQPEMGEGL